MPLIVDLDGTLIGSDLLVESAFGYLGRNPWRIGALVAALARGKAALKSHIAAANEIDVSHLPYNEQVLRLIGEARQSGRPVYLASASNQRYVREVAGHLGLFDGWFASDDAENLSSAAKARRLVEAFGHGGFDYIGNGDADFAVWAVARRRVAVNPSSAVRAKLLKLDPEAVVLARPADRLRTWVKLLRVHQWAKNALVLVPLLTAHKFDPASFGLAIAAFLAFSLAASGIYIVNDLADVEADRKHRTKKHRPLAAGTIPMPEAMVAAAILVAVAVLGGFAIAPAFGGVLCAYIALTIAYTFVLKRKMMVDVIALAMLYTIRVIGGAAAIGVAPSEWLLAFSMFMFASLALIKRYTELAGRLDANQPDPTNRNYRKTDMDIVAALAATAGFNAVTVFSLYVSSDTVRHLYTNPQLLWLICPILMYWIGRALIMAHRRLMDDDPILFAVKDWNSLVAAAAVAAILLAAI
ncbi:MAG: UbiA family prenyltransferase [Methylacidiphilales bacterium]|nr:UbiA family prenyltransferase [Candidatus Methylacidiphilales bacterium]